MYCRSAAPGTVSGPKQWFRTGLKWRVRMVNRVVSNATRGAGKPRSFPLSPSPSPPIRCRGPLGIKFPISQPIALRAMGPTRKSARPSCALTIATRQPARPRAAAALAYACGMSLGIHPSVNSAQGHLRCPVSFISYEPVIRQLAISGIFSPFSEIFLEFTTCTGSFLRPPQKSATCIFSGGVHTG